MITGGTVSIEDGLAGKGQYQPARKVRVELSFGVPDGQSHEVHLKEAASQANSKVNELLGRSVAKSDAPPARPVAAAKQPQMAASSAGPAGGDAQIATPSQVTSLDREPKIPGENAMEMKPTRVNADALADLAKNNPQVLDAVTDQSAPTGLTVKHLADALHAAKARGVDTVVIRKVLAKHKPANLGDRQVGSNELFGMLPPEQKQALHDELKGLNK